LITEQVKNWIKQQDPDFEGRIQLGGVDGNAPCFLGVYPGKGTGRQHMTIGGPGCARYDALSVRLLLRWGHEQPKAERKAKELWSLFHGLSTVEMDGTQVAFADPGSRPIPLGKDFSGVFEYSIDLTIYYMKE
jgi:hypothetical protein